MKLQSYVLGRLPLERLFFKQPLFVPSADVLMHFLVKFFKEKKRNRLKLRVALL